MNHHRNRRHGVAWLEFLFVLAFAALILQLLPTLAQKFLWALDLRNWSRTSWFIVNLMVVAALLGIRFAPDLLFDYRERSKRKAVERAQAEEVRKKMNEREALERMKESRSRRIY